VCVRECPEDAIELAAAEDGVDPLPWADAADALV